MSKVLFEMPYAYVGQVVLWYEQAVRDESLARPAIVLAKNIDSVSVKVFGVGEKDREFTAVRHISDPNTREWDKLEAGGWGHTELERTKSTQQRAVQTHGNLQTVKAK